jgi:hypothetical protein
MLLNQLPRTEFGGLTIAGADVSASLRAKHIHATVATVPTAAGTLEMLLLADGAGTLSLGKIAFKDALAQHDTNFVTFALVNKGQAGAGTTQMLASSPAGTNTTKITGGAAISGYVPYQFVLSATAANLVVAAGDVLALQITGAGTLANTLTEGTIKLVFDQVD